MKSLQTESEQLGTEMLLHSRSPTCAAGSRQRYVVLHSDNERDIFQAMGLENMVKDELEISSFGRRSIRAGVRYIQTPL